MIKYKQLNYNYIVEQLRIYINIMDTYENTKDLYIKAKDPQDPYRKRTRLDYKKLLTDKFFRQLSENYACNKENEAISNILIGTRWYYADALSDKNTQTIDKVIQGINLVNEFIQFNDKSADLKKYIMGLNQELGITAMNLVKKTFEI